MSRLIELFALAGLLASAWGGLERLDAVRLAGEGKLQTELALIDAAIIEHGLRQRVDITIEINGQPVASGFSRPGCDGLLLIAPLPRTAQGWGRVAPQLDLGMYRVRYGYDGAWHNELPRLQRLIDLIKTEVVNGSQRARARVIAVAETGHCALLTNVEVVLANFSQGVNGSLPTAGDYGQEEN